MRNNSWLAHWIVSISLIGLVFLMWALTPSQVIAECGSNPPPDSTCYTCHLEETAHDESLWHGIHAMKDCCTRCHGGNCTSMDTEIAHQGLVAGPLSDIYTNCHSCHPDDYQPRAQIFAAELGITPSSSPTSTPVSASEMTVKPLVILATPTPLTHSTSLIPMLLGGFTFIVVLSLGLHVLITHFRG